MITLLLSISSFRDFLERLIWFYSCLQRWYHHLLATMPNSSFAFFYLIPSLWFSLWNGGKEMEVTEVMSPVQGHTAVSTLKSQNEIQRVWLYPPTATRTLLTAFHYLEEVDFSPGWSLRLLNFIYLHLVQTLSLQGLDNLVFISHLHGRSLLWPYMSSSYFG